MTRLRLVPSPRPQRYCACCRIALPAWAPDDHRLCRACWNWCRAGAALQHAAAALREEQP